MNRCLTGRLVTALLLQFSLAQSTYGETTSSFDEIPTFGGPSSTGAQLIEDNQRQAGDFIQDAMPGWFAFKDKLMNEYGLAIGINYSTLYQKASDALGEDNAWGGIFQLPASWTLLNRGSKNTGTLVFKTENRHRISADLAPQDLGIQGIGVASIVGTQFSDKGWMLTNLYWQQRLNEGKVTVVAGHIDNTDYLGVYGLINPQTSFMNLSFSTNPTIGIPDQGFGGAFGTMLGRNFYAIAGIMDAAGDPAHPGESFSNFFDENEYFTHIEIGYTTSQDRIYFDNINFVYWRSDEQTSNGAVNESKGSGWALSAAHFFQDKYMPFIRIGDSDGGGGALLQRMVSVGLGIYDWDSNELFGFGLSWAEASEDPVGGFGANLDPQYTGEIFYRFHLSKNLAITPDLQYIKNPVLNPNESSVWIIGIRARLAL